VQAEVSPSSVSMYNVNLGGIQALRRLAFPARRSRFPDALSGNRAFFESQMDRFIRPERAQDVQTETLPLEDCPHGQHHRKPPSGRLFSPATDVVELPVLTVPSRVRTVPISYVLSLRDGMCVHTVP